MFSPSVALMQTHLGNSTFFGQWFCFISSEQIRTKSIISFGWSKVISYNYRPPLKSIIRYLWQTSNSILFLRWGEKKKKCYCPPPRVRLSWRSAWLGEKISLALIRLIKISVASSEHPSPKHSSGSVHLSASLRGQPHWPRLDLICYYPIVYQAFVSQPCPWP